MSKAEFERISQIVNPLNSQRRSVEARIDKYSQTIPEIGVNNTSSKSPKGPIQLGQSLEGDLRVAGIKKRLDGFKSSAQERWASINTQLDDALPGYTRSFQQELDARMQMHEEISDMSREGYLDEACINRSWQYVQDFYKSAEPELIARGRDLIQRNKNIAASGLTSAGVEIRASIEQEQSPRVVISQINEGDRSVTLRQGDKQRQIKFGRPEGWERFKFFAQRAGEIITQEELEEFLKQSDKQATVGQTINTLHVKLGDVRDIHGEYGILTTEDLSDEERVRLHTQAAQGFKLNADIEDPENILNKLKLPVSVLRNESTNPEISQVPGAKSEIITEPSLTQTSAESTVKDQLATVSYDLTTQTITTTFDGQRIQARLTNSIDQAIFSYLFQHAGEFASSNTLMRLAQEVNPTSLPRQFTVKNLIQRLRTLLEFTGSRKPVRSIFAREKDERGTKYTFLGHRRVVYQDPLTKEIKEVDLEYRNAYEPREDGIDEGSGLAVERDAFGSLSTPFRQESSERPSSKTKNEQTQPITPHRISMSPESKSASPARVITEPRSLPNGLEINLSGELVLAIYDQLRASNIEHSLTREQLYKLIHPGEQIDGKVDERDLKTISGAISRLRRRLEESDFTISEVLLESARNNNESALIKGFFMEQVERDDEGKIVRRQGRMRPSAANDVIASFLEPER